MADECRMAVFGGNQFAVFGEKNSSGQYIFGKFRLREDENRSEIAQLMPIDPMIYNALKCTLNC